MSNTNKKYKSSDIARILKIKPVTVKKYSQLLEEQGYEFEKDVKGWREYTDTDLETFKTLIRYKRDDIKLNEAVSKAISDTKDIVVVKSELVESDTFETTQLMREFMFKQEEFNLLIAQRLEKQEQRLEQRDKNLMIAMREVLETQKQIANKKKWWKIF